MKTIIILIFILIYVFAFGQHESIDLEILSLNNIDSKVQFNVRNNSTDTLIIYSMSNGLWRSKKQALFRDMEFEFVSSKNEKINQSGIVYGHSINHQPSVDTVFPLTKKMFQKFIMYNNMNFTDTVYFRMYLFCPFCSPQEIQSNDYMIILTEKEKKEREQLKKMAKRVERKSSK